MTEPRDLTDLVPVDVRAEANTAIAVLETNGPAVTEALRQLERATTAAWKAVNMAETTEDEWQLVERRLGIDAAGMWPTGCSAPSVTVPLAVTGQLPGRRSALGPSWSPLPSSVPVTAPEV